LSFGHPGNNETVNIKELGNRLFFQLIIWNKKTARSYIVEYIASGAQADIYKDGFKAIKLFKYNINKEEIEYEINLQKMAYDKGLPVPKIFGIIEIENKFGIEMEYLEGKTIGNIIMHDISKFEEYLLKSIEIQNGIHKIETKNIVLMKDRLKYFILKAKLINENDRERIINELENKVFDNKLCHGDFHFMNLIQTLDGIKIIDWICACSGSPEADIYRTYLLYLLSNKELAGIYLDTYCKIMQLDKNNILSWASIIAGARLGEYIKDENEKNILLKIIAN